MITILAEAADTTTGTWAAFGAVCAVIIGAVGVQISNWQKGKREQQNADKDNQLTTEIRNVLRQIEIETTKQNGKLDSILGINKAQHDALLSSLSGQCKYNPPK